MRNACIYAATLLLLAAAPYPDRQRIVAGWQIEDVAEQDGGRLVRLYRAAGGYRLQFQAAFWRGNDGRIQTILVEHSDCTDGDELGRHAAPRAAEIRALFARHLADCGASPRLAARLLRGLGPAWRLASAWADAAEAAARAEGG
jgi:hypothetical protein